jgi:hypothetical protein
VSNPTTTPPGWYADPNGAPTLRWWDGAGWTEHYAPAAPIAPMTPERPRLAAETKVDGVWIWLVAALPIVSIASYFLIDFRGYMQGIMTGDIRGAMGSFWVGYLAALALSWVAYGAVVLFSYFDWRGLRAAGVVRPFHWAWAFLGGIVYLIGRTVILRKVSNRGFGPLWAGIAVYVAVVIVGMVWSIWMMTDMMQNMRDFIPYGPYDRYDSFS